MKVLEKVNVAPSSDEGHFVIGAKQVIEIDKVNEVFDVVGKSTLSSKNHTTLEMEEDCTIFCQMVYDSKLERLKKIED